jgi:hypothetical protein
MSRAVEGIARLLRHPQTFCRVEPKALRIVHGRIPCPDTLDWEGCARRSTRVCAKLIKRREWRRAAKRRGVANISAGPSLGCV